MKHSLTTVIALLALVWAAFAAVAEDRGPAWKRHTIDNASRGADGVRLADVNGDGLPDIATGWEEGGVTRVYLHPGQDRVRQEWPAVTVGKTASAEDAVFVDLDGDGRTDVATSCEGGTRTIFIHWAPREPKDYLNAAAWTTEPLPASQKRAMWMYCLPRQIDGRHGIDLIAGAKGENAAIGWFQAPADARNVDQWKWRRLSKAGWIMSLESVDMDGDGDEDILTTDRKGALRGLRWLENPGVGADQTAEWTNQFIGGRDQEVMFLTRGDLDGDGVPEIVVATRSGGVLLFERSKSAPAKWSETVLPMPANVGTGKGVAVGDVDGNGEPDIVVSCENATGGQSGVFYLTRQGAPGDWTAREISGPAGIKFDRLELFDLDGDGDLDLLACEESEPVDGKRHGLGLFWYENPTGGK